jgi:two-component system, OmpR family, phosphate regulon response regulator OmpR
VIPVTVGARIAPVDDDDAIRALLATVLKRRGLRVDMARNGVEAVTKLAECRYSLVLLDLMMPLMSGYQVLEHIADESLSTRPLVLVLTAGLEPRGFDTSFVVGTIHKPFDVELLVDTVMGCLTVTQPLPADTCRPSEEILGSEQEKAN